MTPVRMVKSSLQTQVRLRHFWKNLPHTKVAISMPVSTSSAAKLLERFPIAMCFSLSYDVLPKLENLHVLKTDTDWIDIGSPERLQAAQQLF